MHQFLGYGPISKLSSNVSLPFCTNVWPETSDLFSFMDRCVCGTKPPKLMLFQCIVYQACPLSMTKSYKTDSVVHQPNSI